MLLIIRMLIQLYELLQISASVTTACKGDGVLVNLTVNGTMESRCDLSETAAGSQNLIPLPRREIRMLDNKDYLHYPCTLHDRHRRTET